MKKITLREANQQFSKLIRQVEETGEEVVVLRNGKGAARIVPMNENGVPKLTPEQEAARRSLIESARNSPGNSEGRRWTRDELYDR